MSATESFRAAFSFAQFASLLYFVDRFMGRVDLVHGPSMQPTLAPVGALVLVDKWCVRPFFSEAPALRRNDIVLCDSHCRASFVICKRVVGVGGDALLLRDRGEVVRVPPGHVWLEGDNPLDSHDSRAYGAVPAALVQGRVAACVWPPWSARAFARGAPPGAGVLRNGSNAVLLPAAGGGGEVINGAAEPAEGWAAFAAAEVAAAGGRGVGWDNESRGAEWWGPLGGESRDALEDAFHAARLLVDAERRSQPPPELR